MTDKIDILRSALYASYPIERKLGAGGMAIVYLAEDLKQCRKVAVRFATDTISFNDLSRFAIEQQGPYTYAVTVQGETTLLTLFTSYSCSTAHEHAEKIGAFLPLQCHDEVESP